MVTCCVDGCVQTKEDLIFFKFPNSRTLRRKWLDVISTSEKINLDSVICSQHFLEEQYETVRGKNRLKPKVVPSLFVKMNKSKSPHQSHDTITNTNTVSNGAVDDRDVERRLLDDVKKIIMDAEIVKSTPPDISPIIPEANEDIEEILTNYQIKQIRPLNREGEIQSNKDTHGSKETTGNEEIKINSLAETVIEIEIPALGPLDVSCSETNEIGNKEIENREIVNDVIDVDDEKDPVFIEVSVDKGAEGQDTSNPDCLMLLESVQCEVDPTSLMFPDPEPEPDPGDDSDVMDLGEKKEDPISLLTSSDEDEVIIEEPKYEIVDVSDETDEDDLPLLKLLERRKPKKPTKTKSSKHKSIKAESRTHTSEDLTKILWGKMYEYFCMECHFKTTSKAEYRKHANEHATVMQVCQVCGYTTASKQQYMKHERRHKGDKKFKCHLCDYKARHDMSLLLHLKTHESVSLVSVKRGFKCQKCNFQSGVKASLLRHIRTCTTERKEFSCGKCRYETNRRSDMKRHKLTRHEDMDTDDEYIP